MVLLVVRTVTLALSVFVTYLWMRRRSRRIFYRTLRRAGLSEAEAGTLTACYHARIGLRNAIGIVPRTLMKGAKR
jgi:hypothetical protein